MFIGHCSIVDSAWRAETPPPMVCHHWDTPQKETSGSFQSVRYGYSRATWLGEVVIIKWWWITLPVNTCLQLKHWKKNPLIVKGLLFFQMGKYFDQCRQCFCNTCIFDSCWGIEKEEVIPNLYWFHNQCKLLLESCYSWIAGSLGFKGIVLDHRS